MAHGKAAARDILYGCRGGRWAATSDRADAVLAYLDTARSRGLADGTWPDGTPKGLAPCRVCGLPRRDHQPPCRWCGRAPEHHQPGDVEAEVEGWARMARARVKAQVPLTDLDREALRLTGDAA